MIGTTVLGIDSIYILLGTVSVLSGSGVVYATLGGADPSKSRIVRFWKVLLVIFIFSVLMLALYYYLASTGWLIIFTLFADDHRADNFRTMDEIFPSATIDAGDDVWELSSAEHHLPETYTFKGETRSVPAFLERTETTGLVVVHEETIVNESYYQGYDEADQVTSWSVGKSYASALTGIAIEEGYIESVDDRVITYVPELEGSGYENATVYDLLTMSSGVAFNEDYDAFTSDINMLFPNAYGFNESWIEQMAAIESDHPPGTHKNYASSDTVVLGLVIERATGRPYHEYMQESLWKPAGKEGAAFSTVDRTNTDVAMCCLNAQLRDYTRFGLLYLNDGARNGNQIVPADWVSESTVPQPPHEEPDGNAVSIEPFGYGYNWWIPEQSTHEFLAIGVWGQYIYVDTEAEVVITKTSTDYYAAENDDETIELFRAIVDSVAD